MSFMDIFRYRRVSIYANLSYQFAILEFYNIWNAIYRISEYQTTVLVQAWLLKISSW